MDGARPIDQKFCKVPFDYVAEQAALLLSEPMKKRMSVFAVHFDFGENRKSNAVGALAEGCDFGVRPWFLMAELVTRETKNFKAARPELFVEPLQADILRCEPAL